MRACASAITALTMGAETTTTTGLPARLANPLHLLLS